MKIAVVGCGHGCLDSIYAACGDADALVVCGDFQAVRSEADLAAMSVPVKYRKLGDFHEYFSGIKKAPILTVFIGGNHEASNHLRELRFGGWVCENVYFLGESGCVKLSKSVRLFGISGIFKHHDYLRGKFEEFPYSPDDLRSVYHVRECESARLKMLLRLPTETRVSIGLSHDWPRGVEKLGDLEGLLRKKKHFKKDVLANRLGSPPAMDLLKAFRPDFWLSGHMHVKFEAVVEFHKAVRDSDEIDDSDDDDGDRAKKITKFLALDKVAPKRSFLEIIEIDTEDPVKLEYDLEWLAVLKTTIFQTPTSREFKGRTFFDATELLKNYENLKKNLHARRGGDLSVEDLNPFRRREDASSVKRIKSLEHPQTQTLFEILDE